MTATAQSIVTEEQIQSLRRRGWRGGIITPHRAFAHLHFSKLDLWITIASVAAMTAGWLGALSYVGEFWFRIFRFWHKFLGLEGSVARAPQHWGPLKFSLPTVLISAGPPASMTWWITAAVTFLVLWITFGMSEEQLPWVYLLRFLVIVQGTALVYFEFAAARFPHDLPSYTVGMLYFGTIFITLLPLILGFSYFLFDFQLRQKFGLTLGTMAYLVVFLPFQYMLHAWIIHYSILFMPILYFVFGPFLDVLIFVSLYSWGMSWPSRAEIRRDVLA
jgi:hypothetical protein